MLFHVALAFLGFGLWSVGDAMLHALPDRGALAVVFWSSVAGLLLLLALSSCLGGLADTFRKPRQGLQWARGGVLLVTNVLGVYAFTHLPLTTAYALVLIQPICAKAIAVLLTGERVSVRAWASSALGFAGVLIVLRPGFVPVSLPALAALAAAFCFALGYVLTRFIGQENQTTLGTALYRYVLAVAAIPVLGGPSAVVLPVDDMPWVAAIGFLTIAGMLAVSRAYAVAPAAFIAPVHYTQILWGTAFGALFFSECPDAWTLAGGAVIIAAGLWLLSGVRKEKETA